MHQILAMIYGSGNGFIVLLFYVNFAADVNRVLEVVNFK